MTTDLIKDLRAAVEGEVHSDAIHCAIYSVDASIYEVEPLAIALPKNTSDVLATMRTAAKYDVPVIPRGAATGIAGGCIGRGVVLDLARHMREILEIHPQEGWARCQPGVVQKQLNEAAAQYGLRLGPDTSTGNRATLGGMVANNSCGAHALKYGQMVDHVQEVELVTADGSLLRLAPISVHEIEAKSESFTVEGAIYREVERIRDEDAEEIRLRMPPVPRRASGYNLDRLLDQEKINLSQVIVGSEGSLGVVTEIKVALVPQLKQRCLCLLAFEYVSQLFDAVTETLEYSPVACEMIDQKILTAGRSAPMTAKRSSWIQGTPAGILVVEFEDNHSKAKALAETMRRRGIVATVIQDEKTINDVWAIRASGLGLLLSKRSYSRAIGFLEDVVVAPEQLSSFMEAFLTLLQKHGKDPGVYGHAGRGAMHVRPFIDLTQASEVRLMRQLMEKTTDLLLDYGGFLSGEHGDGLVRSWLNERLFGPQLYRSFVSLKQTFDPDGRMNPGKVVAAQEVDDNLRINPDTRQRGLDTQFDFSREGGIALAADLCNGNAACRKREGLMCPSFQAYGDEYHTTRARAQALRAVMNRRLPLEAFTSDEMHGVMEFCLECKGCKTECPSQVDMAKLKAEFLYHYQEERGYSLRSRLFGHVSRLNRRASPFRPLYNGLMRSWLGRQGLRLLGITAQRSVPALARRFSKQWKNRLAKKGSRGKVVLFIDTFTEFNEPENGLAAADILERLGFEVIRTKYRCCGRPLISKGLLKEAKRYAATLIETLWPYAKQGLPIVGLEPSCLLTITDDFPDLIVSNMTDEVITHCYPLDVFLEKLSSEEKLPWRDDLPAETVHVHTHCHQKALIGTQPTLNLLAQIPNITAHSIDAGCCGMAGSFGYETEHYSMSMAIAENKLLPAIRKTSVKATILADGMSCRGQIHHGTHRQAQHIAHFLRKHLS